MMDVQNTPSKFQLQSQEFNKYLDKYFDKPNSLCLWPHQVEAIKSIRNHLNDSSKPQIALCVLPTGAGKSGIAVMTAYACNARRVLVITPSKHISKQMLISFCDDDGQSFLVKRGIVKKEAFNRCCRPDCKGVVSDTNEISSHFDRELVIANAHKFGSKSRVKITDIQSEGVDLLIVDEAHHYPAETWRTVVNHFSTAKKLFLTATPKNRGQNILDNQRECLCYEVDKKELIRRGIIRNVAFDDESSSSNTLDAFRVSMF